MSPREPANPECRALVEALKADPRIRAGMRQVCLAMVDLLVAHALQRRSFEAMSSEINPS
jgi:hypothetical protein